MADPLLAPSVVVGIDGSASAIRAAQWAVDEAFCLDLPLRLIHVMTSRLDPQSVIDRAVHAVEARDLTVKVEAEIVRGHVVTSLMDTSAVMICVGAAGSTAAALAAEAHCPIAIIRGTVRPLTERPGWIVVELTKAPASAALLAIAVHEARLRSAPLRVISSPPTQLDVRQEQWQSRYPDLDIRPVALTGSAVDYLIENADAVDLVIVGANADPTSAAALRNASYSILVSDRQRLL